MSDKNPFLEDKKEVVEKGSIGFQNARPLQKGEKVKRHQDYLPGKKLRTFTKLSTIFGVIFSILSMMYFLLPIFSAVIGALLAVIIIFFMIASVLFTLGMVLINDGYRNWIGNNMMDVPNFFFNLSNNITKLAPYYLVVAIPALILTLTGLILGIIGKAKKYRYFTSYIVLNAIFFTFALLFTIFYFAGGMSIITF